MEIVIVPAWRRPAFLLATLRRLLIADEGSQHYWIALDRGFDPACWGPIREFTHQLGQRAQAVVMNHSYRGNSYNVLHTYERAMRRKPSLIHLVEEDILVGKDYFAFHREAHRLAPDVFAVSAARNQNNLEDPAPYPDALYLAPEYQSVAVSFRTEKLAPIIPHLVREYFRTPVAYCQKRWPKTRIPVGNAEQDGLLNRLCEAAGLRVAYACRPRAYHAGFTGYHRDGLLLTGSVRDQADRILAMTEDELNKAAYSYQDHRTVALDAALPAPSRLISWP